MKKPSRPQELRVDDAMLKRAAKRLAKARRKGAKFLMNIRSYEYGGHLLIATARDCDDGCTVKFFMSIAGGHHTDQKFIWNAYVAPHVRAPLPGPMPYDWH
jgi:hypothetical protein